VSDNTIGREASYTAKGRAFPDIIANEVASSYSVRRTNNSAERYLNSHYRRAIEVILASGILLLAMPVLLIAALSVRVSSPGPVLFRQFRHGKDMTMFEMAKLRSMHWSNDPDPVVRQAMRNDPRVTPVGRILRSTSLDELPQLFSVIKGDMSLIGPRPHAIEHDFYYRELIPQYSERFRARPGITGLAQVSGARGPTPNLDDMKRRIDLDVLYLQEASLMLDFRILLRTVREVFASETAF
jgi:putative colanic acid biosysnthesis UDP-glucose lipid carrier transferase